MCASCHSLERIHYRELAGVMMPEDEAKALAKEIDVTDGPNDEGEMFQRPGELKDPLPAHTKMRKRVEQLMAGPYPPIFPS